METTKTPKEWLAEVKADTSKLNSWLSQQWLAEDEAATRIANLAATEPEAKKARLLLKIATDEAIHAHKLSILCLARGLKKAKASSGRYYAEMELDSLSRDELYAAGYYAEGMRLSRITAIVGDPDIDEDIRETFLSILRDEEMHEKAFELISSDKAKSAVKSKHEAGMKALGLTI